MTALRRQFIREFGALLQPRGFFLWKGNFYRVDAEAELVWIVTMEELEGGPNLWFDVGAFCAFDATKLSRGTLQFSVFWRDLLGKIDASRMYDSAYQISACAMVLREILLDRFVSMRNLKELRSFREWFWNRMEGRKENMPWLPSQGLEYIRCKEYAAAGECLKISQERLLDACGKRPHMLELPDVQEAQRLYRDLLDLLEKADYAQLQNYVEERCRIAKKEIARFFEGGVCI